MIPASFLGCRLVYMSWGVTAALGITMPKWLPLHSAVPGLWRRGLLFPSPVRGGKHQTPQWGFSNLHWLFCRHRLQRHFRIWGEHRSVNPTPISSPHTLSPSPGIPVPSSEDFTNTQSSYVAPGSIWPALGSALALTWH